MRFAGSRRARGLILLLTLILMLGVAHALRQQAVQVRARLGPALLAHLQQALKREVIIERFLMDQPGVLVIEGLQVARQGALKDGVFLRTRRVELRYDPRLLDWRGWLAGAVGALHPARVLADGVTLPHPTRTGVLPMLECPHLEAEVDLARVMADPALAAGAVNWVELSRAVGSLTRRTDGTWDLSELLPAQKERKGGFRGQLRGRACTLHLSDYRSGRIPAPARTEAHGDFEISFAGHPTLRYHASGTVAGIHGGRFFARGSHRKGQKLGLISLDAQTEDLSYWQRYLAVVNAAPEIVSGGGRLRGVLWEPADGDLAPGFQLVLGLDGVRARHPTLPAPLEQVRGDLVLDPEHVSGSGTLLWKGIRVTAVGALSPRGSYPPARWTLTAAQAPDATVRDLLRLAHIPAELQPSGISSISVEGEGDATRWRVQGRLTAARAVWARPEEAYTAREAALTFTGDLQPGVPPRGNGALSLDRLLVRNQTIRNTRVEFSTGANRTTFRAAATALGGRWGAEGTVDATASPARLAVRGQAVGLDPQALAVGEEPLAVSGWVDGEFHVEGPLDHWRGGAELVSRSLSFDGRHIPEATARIQWDGERVLVRRASLSFPFGALHATGSITPDLTTDLLVSASAVNLALLPGVPADLDLRGWGSAQLRVTGRAAAPAIQGEVQVSGLKAGQVELDWVDAQVSAPNLHEVVIHRLAVRRGVLELGAERVTLQRVPKPTGPGTAESGPSPLGDWQIAGELQVSPLTLVQAMRWLGIAPAVLEHTPIGGHLTALRVTVAGPLAAPQVSFSARAEDCVVRRHDLGVVTATGEWDSLTRRLKLAAAESRSPEGVASLAGVLEWSPEGKDNRAAAGGRRGEEPQSGLPPPALLAAMHLRFRVGGVRLLPLLRRYAPGVLEDVDLQGTLEEVSGEVIGSPEAPVLTAAVRLAGLVVDQRAVALEPFRLRWTNELLVLRNIAAPLGAGRFQAPLMLIRAQTRPVRDPAQPAEAVRDPEAGFRDAAGLIEVNEVPVAVLQQLLMDSPYYASDEAEPLRRVLQDWRGSISGRLTGTLRIGRLPDAIAPGDESRLLARWDREIGTGRLEARLEVPDLRAEEVSGEPTTRVVLAGAYHAGRFEIEQARVEGAGAARFTAAGFLEHERKGAPGAVRLLLAGEGVSVESLARLPLAALRERLAGLQPLDGRISFKGEVTGTPRLPVAQLSGRISAPLLGGVPFDEIVLTGGTYDARPGRLSVGGVQFVKQRGNGVEPASFTLSGSLPLGWPNLASAPDLPRDLTISVPKQSLQVLNELAEETDTLARRTGEAAAGRVRTLTRLFRDLAATDAQLDGGITLGGTAARPQNSGKLEVNGRILRVEELDTGIRDFRAVVRLDGDTVHLDEFSGHSTVSGGFAGTGTLRLGGEPIRPGPATLPAPLVDLKLAANGLRFIQKNAERLLGPSFRGTQLSGTLQTVSLERPEVSQPLLIQGRWPNLVVRGGIRLDETNVGLMYEPIFSDAPPPTPADARLDLSLYTGNNVWLRNPQARLQLDASRRVGGDAAPIRVTGAWNIPTVLGTLTTRKGVLNIPGFRLSDVEGSLSLNYDRRRQALGSGGPVTVDLTASTNMRLQRTAGPEADDYEVTFRLRGTPGGREAVEVRTPGVNSGLVIGGGDGLQVSIRTDPPLPASEITALIRQRYGVGGFAGGGSNVEATFRSQIEQAFVANVASTVLGLVEDRVQSRLGLDLFSLEVGVADPLRVRLGKQLFDRVYATVSQEFGSTVTAQRRMELYYRFSPAFRFGLRREDPLGQQIFFFSGSASF